MSIVKLISWGNAMKAPTRIYKFNYVGSLGYTVPAADVETINDPSKMTASRTLFMAEKIED